MNIKPVPHKTLADAAAGKIAAFILDKKLKPGDRLPPERDLMKQLGVSRSTLREALKVLAESQLIEARPGVGWFACAINEKNLAKAHILAQGEREPPSSKPSSSAVKFPSGMRRLPVSPEKPLYIPNLSTDRLGTFNFISWWDREKVKNAKVLVVGAGALGNEVIKNFALMGVGNIFIIDFDTIEAANLSRSVLFRECDSSRNKAEVAAARAKEINPDIHVQYLHGDVTTQIGLGVIRRMDVILGCLDSREARLAVNRFAYWMNKPWVDGAIQELLGLVRVFIPGKGACFECSLTEQARRDLSIRYSCPLLARENILRGKVPTTPTIASIIGAMQCQEALKIIHAIPVDAGKVVHFNGITNEMHTTAYREREDCESHWIYGDVIELPARSDIISLDDLLRIARSDLGPDAIIELDQELVLALECQNCHTVENILRPISEVSFEAAHCPNCGVLRNTKMTHTITGEEPFLHRTLASLGIPLLHILRAYNAQEFHFYELTGDLPDALHFNHFEKSRPLGDISLRDRIRLGEEVKLKVSIKHPARSRIVLHD